MSKSVRMLDRATAPTVTKARAALDEVGGAAWAYYLGGAGHFHDRTTYTPALVAEYHKAGIKTLPIYAGAQTGFSRARGLSDAKDAVARAKKFGDEHAPVMVDIERGPHDKNPTAALAYARAFCEGVHKAGMRAGVYGPFELMERLTATANKAQLPDVLWPARWISDPGKLPAQTKWPTDARKVKGIDAGKLASPGNRAWQFVGDVVLPKANINVDISVIDLDCFDKGATPAKPTRTTAATPKPKPVTATTTTPKPKPAPKPVARAVVVKSGDTLSALERHHGVPHGSLFAKNKAVIEAAAHSHGHASSKNGGLIFPGTKLTLP